VTTWSDEESDYTFRLTHIPARNDIDDTAALLAAQSQPSPEARRCTDAVIWQADTGHDPVFLSSDVRRWVHGHCAREGLDAGPIGSYYFAELVGSYCLGRRDGALAYEDAPPHDDPAPSGTLACVLSALCGSVVTLGLGLIGFWLAH
jgi:hypothetical protein